jgi:hypothetical protein
MARSNLSRNGPTAGLQWLDDLRADLRYAIRTLIRTPAFALTAIVSLALGIGVNTIVFSVVNALVLNHYRSNGHRICSFCSRTKASRRSRFQTIAICAIRTSRLPA